MNIYNKLKEYFENTSQKQLNKDWEEIAELNEIGPTMDEYLNPTSTERW